MSNGQFFDFFALYFTLHSNQLLIIKRLDIDYFNFFGDFDGFDLFSEAFVSLVLGEGEWAGALIS